MRKFDVSETNRSLSHGKYGKKEVKFSYQAFEPGLDDPYDSKNLPPLPPFEVGKTNSDLALRTLR